MKIFTEDREISPRDSIQFFKEHYEELGKVHYVLLYYAEKEWAINPNLYHQYVIIIGENTQIRLLGLTWGYYGSGPSGLHDLLQLIDPTITYEQITGLEWMAEYIIVFENLNGKLVLTPLNKVIQSYLSRDDPSLPRGMFYQKRSIKELSYLT